MGRAEKIEERVERFELSSSAWKDEALPLGDTRVLVPGGNRTLIDGLRDHGPTVRRPGHS
jgi:hypothetical protein